MLRKWRSSAVADVLRARGVLQTGVAAYQKTIAEFNARQRADIEKIGLRECALPTCDKVERTVREFKQCSGCRSVWYCSPEHHTLDWGAHKKDCNQLDKARRAAAAAGGEGPAGGRQNKQRGDVPCGGSPFRHAPPVSIRRFSLESTRQFLKASECRMSSPAAVIDATKSEEDDEKKRRRKRSLLLLLLLLLCCCTTVGLAVGLGVGLGVKSSSSPSASPPCTNASVISANATLTGLFPSQFGACLRSTACLGLPSSACVSSD